MKEWWKNYKGVILPLIGTGLLVAGWPLYFAIENIISDEAIKWVSKVDNNGISNGFKFYFALLSSLIGSAGIISIFFGIYFFWTQRPIEKKAESLLEKSGGTLEVAKALLGPIANQNFVIGSPKGNEMMDVIFKDYYDDPQTLNISFMGTAYGAFSLNPEDSDYGFLHALKQHIRNCEGETDTALGKIKFVCGNKPLYSLSAKYLCLELLSEIKKHAQQQIEELSVAYPYEDCIPATLIISGGSGPRALIAPSIGQEDKDFLAKYYSIGFIIKDIKGSKASNVIKRLRNPFETHMKNTPEEWVLDRHAQAIEISNLHRIKFVKCVSDAIAGNNMGELGEFEHSFFRKLFKPEFDNNAVIVTEPFHIPFNQIESASKFIACCIKEIEKETLINKGS